MISVCVYVIVHFYCARLAEQRPVIVSFFPSNFIYIFTYVIYIYISLTLFLPLSVHEGKKAVSFTSFAVAPMIDCETFPKHFTDTEKRKVKTKLLCMSK